MEGGINHKDLKRIIGALERSAKAQEDLIRLATEERDLQELVWTTPVCPFCGTTNPTITNRGGEGPMAEFVLVADCGNCQSQFFAIPMQWNYYKTRNEAINEVEGRGK